MPLIVNEWKYDERIWSTASMLDDSKIIFGCWDQRVHCLNIKSGEEEWSFKTNGPIYSSPVVLENGDFVIGSDEGVLWKITCSGELLWKIEGNGSFHGTPLIDENNKIVYAGCYDHHMYAIDLEYGSIIWKQIFNPHILEDIYSSPALTPQENIVFGTGHEVICLNKFGDKIWDFKTFGNVDSTAAIDYELNIGMLGSEDGFIYGFDVISGEVLWKVRTGDVVVSSAAISYYHQACIGSNDKKLYCVNLGTGDLIWTKDIGNKSLYTSFTTLPNGDYLVVVGGKLICIDYLDGSIVWEVDFPQGVHSPPLITPNGKIVVGSHFGSLYLLSW